MNNEKSMETETVSFPLSKPGRPTERRLLFFVTLIFAAGLYVLFRNGLFSQKYNAVSFGIIISASFWVLHIFLTLRQEKGDEIFLPLACFLIVLGWLEIYRLSAEIAYRQMIWILIGEFAFILCILFIRNYRKLEDYKYLFLVGAIALEVLVSVFGVEVNGAKLWFDFGYFSVQPVEFIKIFLTIFLASYLRKNREMLIKPFVGKESGTVIRYYMLLLFLWGTAEISLIIQKDLGMALLLFGVFMGLFYVTTRRIYLITVGLGFFTGGSIILYHIFDHVKTRFDMWWNPWPEQAGRGFQIVQALYSFANGGIAGAGLGKGQPFFIPVVSTDFIFAALAEESVWSGC